MKTQRLLIALTVFNASRLTRANGLHRRSRRGLAHHVGRGLRADRAVHGGHIETDINMRTSVAGIFAAGDGATAAISAFRYLDRQRA